MDFDFQNWQMFLVEKPKLSIQLLNVQKTNSREHDKVLSSVAITFCI